MSLSVGESVSTGKGKILLILPKGEKILLILLTSYLFTAIQ